MNVLTISCAGKIIGKLAWKILNELGVCWVGIGLVLCPFPCDVFVMYWPRTPPLAPSVNDCSLEADYFLQVFIDLALEIYVVVSSMVDISMDSLVILSKLVVVFDDGLFNPVGNHQGLQAVSLIISLNLNNLQMEGFLLPFGIIHL